MSIENLIYPEIPFYMEYITEIDENIYCKALRYGGSERVDIYLCTKNSFIKKMLCSLQIDNYIPMVKYKNDKLLIYSGVYNREINDYDAIKVFKLYNINDDMFYSLTEKEALETFDSSITTDKLKTPNRNICINTNEKRKTSNKAKIKVLKKD